jgi:branched-chain amino acid transport system permease protein
MAIMRTRMQWGMFIALFILLALLPLIVPLRLGELSLGLPFFIFIGISIITLHGLNIVTGYCGQISLGQAAFMAVGAFASANLVVRVGLPFLIALPLAGLMAALIGIIFGAPSLRIKGFYLALSTLAAHFIIVFVIVRLPQIGGTLGQPVPPASIAGFEFGTDFRYYYLVLAITALMTFLAKNIARTRAGRAFVAIRDNDLAAEVMGINVFAYKVLAFGISAFYGGIAGALTAFYIGFTSIESFQLLDAIWYLGMLVVGGMGSVMGAIFGAILFRLIDELSIFIGPALHTTFPFLPPEAASGLAMMLWALTIILFLILEPRGINHRWEIFKAYYRLHPYSH